MSIDRQSPGSAAAPEAAETGVFAAGRRVGVLLPVPLPPPQTGRLDYLVPDGLSLRRGDLVAVPLGSRQVDGCVWDAGDGGIDEARLRPVIARHDAPPLPEVSRRFVDWVAGYTLSPPGAVLRMAMSVSAALAAPAPLPAYRLAEAPPALPARALTRARRRVLGTLAGQPPLTAADIAREAGCGVEVVRRMAALGLDFERLPATTVSDLDRAEAARLAGQWERPMRQTEVACLASHRGAWRRVTWTATATTT